MNKKVTFYLDKADGIVTLHQNKRTDANKLAEGQRESLCVLLTMLLNEIGGMPNDGTISVTINKQL